MFHWYCSGFWPLRPVDEISNAKLSISFARQLRRRLFFSRLSPVRISVSSYRFFISNMGLTLSILSAGLRGHTVRLEKTLAPSTTPIEYWEAALRWQRVVNTQQQPDYVSTAKYQMDKRRPVI